MGTEDQGTQAAHQDRVARKLLMKCLVIGAKTPREAFEMAAGRPSTDEEWAKHGSAWERNWDECSELRRIVVETERTMQESYERYLKDKR